MAVPEAIDAATSPAMADELTSPNAQASGAFGAAVSVSGRTLAVGAPLETADSDAGAGAAYLFNAKTGALAHSLTSPNAIALGDFGASIGVSGSTVVVGAPRETDSGQSSAGNAYVFDAKSGALVWTLSSPNALTDGAFGSSVAVSGATVVVGAFAETADGNAFAGHAYIFDAKTGALLWTLSSPNSQAGGYFGYSVAVSGSTVVVGAPLSSASGVFGSGAAYTFDAKTGAPLATFTSPNALSDGLFGASVAVSGTTVVVGAPDETSSSVAGAGNAYVFDAKTSARVGTLTSSNPSTDGAFGFATAVAGTTVYVGAPDESEAGFSDAGHVYTFNAGTGAPIATLGSPNGQTSGAFGESVAASGTSVAVGAPGETAAGEDQAGRVYTFNSEKGTQIPALDNPSPQTDEFFGFSVAASGTTVVIGAPGENVSGSYEAGQAFLFDAKTGTLIATLTSPNVAIGGLFGYFVAVSGATVVVGAPGETASGDAGAGHAYVFDAGTGALERTLTSPNAQAYGSFGYSVAVSGSTAVVGAPGETDSEALDGGNAYVFDSSTGALVSALSSPNAQGGGYFGFAVAVGGGTVAVGAPDETVSGAASAGHVYLFSEKTGRLRSTLASPSPQADGYFGDAVALSGATVAVGSPGVTVSGDLEAGEVFLFEASKGTLRLSLNTPDPVTDANFGLSIGLSGSTVVVGAYGENALGLAVAGHAYVFEGKSGVASWILTSPNAQTLGTFGYSVAVSGRTVVVGASGETVSTNDSAGTVYTFDA